MANFFSVPAPMALSGGLGTSGSAPYVRVGGFYTRFTFQGQTIAFVDVIRETAPQPVARPQAIQPIDQPFPVEIAFPMALQAGTLDVSIRELWASEVWTQLPGYGAAQNLLEVFQANLNLGLIACTKTILWPNGGSRTVNYHGCAVTNVQIDETVAIDTMSLPKTITIMYLQRTWVDNS